MSACACCKDSCISSFSAGVVAALSRPCSASMRPCKSIRSVALRAMAAATSPAGYPLVVAISPALSARSSAAVIPDLPISASCAASCSAMRLCSAFNVATRGVSLATIGSSAAAGAFSGAKVLRGARASKSALGVPAACSRRSSVPRDSRGPIGSAGGAYTFLTVNLLRIASSSACACRASVIVGFLAASNRAMMGSTNAANCCRSAFVVCVPRAVSISVTILARRLPVAASRAAGFAISNCVSPCLRAMSASWCAATSGG